MWTFLHNYICRPVINMRELPSQNSRVISQALFAEEIQIIQQQDDWLLIQTPDQYQGWIPASSFVQRKTAYLPNIKTTRLKAHLYSEPDVEFGPLTTLPLGSPLVLLNQETRWAQVELPDSEQAFIQTGDLKAFPPEDLLAFSRRFLGLPYTWGGRSSFGFDCSGFIQMLYAQKGILLPRDSKDQAQDPRFQPVQDPLPGDLIFFGHSPSVIKHVGLNLGQNQFIHASSIENLPWLRLSYTTDPEWVGSRNAYYPYRFFCRFLKN